MSEAVKTAVFVATAVFVVAIAFFSRPDSGDLAAGRGSIEGSELVEGLDVQDIRELRVVRYDESTSRAKEFVVANDGGLWSIPSKYGYPADASDQLADVALSVIGKKILRQEGDNASLHEERGLLDPASSDRRLGDKGVGTRLTMVDARSEPLADIIIGNQVEEDSDQYYVRYADQDIVYVADVDPSKLSTKFEDWIEDDLLKLDSFDIQQVLLKDYSFEVKTVLGPQGLVADPDWERRGQLKLAYDSGDAKWEAEQIEVFDKEQNKYVDRPLASDEQLDDAVLNDLRNALDDLKIVDVEKKPEGLSEDLKTSQEFLRSQEALQSLLVKGYFPVQTTDTNYEILSSEGEAVITLKSGVEYILRFGDLQVSGDQPLNNQGETASQAEGETDERNADGIHRYLFVMAQLNEAVIEKPQLEEEPPLPAGAEEAAEQQEATDEVSSTSEGEGTAEGDASPESSDAESAVTDEPAQDATKDVEPGAADSELDAIIAQRKKIREENKKKMDEYDRKIQEARQKVEELNLRFGDWYYVISNDTYQKIHLDLEQVITAKTAEEGATESDAVGEFGTPGGAIPNLPPVGLDAGPQLGPPPEIQEPAQENILEVEVTTEDTDEAKEKEADENQEATEADGTKEAAAEPDAAQDPAPEDEEPAEPEVPPTETPQ